MLSQFWRKKHRDPADPKQLRASILEFVKDQFLRLEGGEGIQLQKLTLYLYPEPSLRFLHETAVQFNEPDFFKSEIQRLAENYAVELPLQWDLEILFTDMAVPEAINSDRIAVGIQFFSMHKKQTVGEKMILRVLQGKANTDSYMLSPGMSRLNIGREEQVQLQDGSIRINNLAFPAAIGDGNKYVSRQHAHLEWDESSATFRIFADVGGVPPGNKTKIRISADGSLHRLNSIQVGLVLNDGDQLILGDQVVLSFNKYLI